MWSSALHTADDPLGLQLVLYLDNDDPTLGGYDAWIRSSGVDNGRIAALKGPRNTLLGTWHRCWEAAAGEIGWLGNDNVRFRTPGWDILVRHAFEQTPDRVAFLQDGNGIHDGVLGALGFLHRHRLKTGEYLIPPPDIFEDQARTST